METPRVDMRISRLVAAAVSSLSVAAMPIPAHVRGYDLASGVGTVNAARFVSELAALAGH
jgi:hypothetical protein